MFFIKFLPNFEAFFVFLRISQDFADLPRFHGSATTRNNRSPVSLIIKKICYSHFKVKVIWGSAWGFYLHPRNLDGLILYRHETKAAPCPQESPGNSAYLSISFNLFTKKNHWTLIILYKKLNYYMPALPTFINHVWVDYFISFVTM